ncbi:hypothetical protein EDC01DRAFT_777869 [Geopyxis carbonaria]|nr:hypothetical protein EDC01DRAFT_777869 [Geopyxis carbonaria]
MGTLASLVITDEARSPSSLSTPKPLPITPTADLGSQATVLRPRQELFDVADIQILPLSRRQRSCRIALAFRPPAPFVSLQAPHGKERIDRVSSAVRALFYSTRLQWPRVCLDLDRKLPALIWIPSVAELAELDLRSRNLHDVVLRYAVRRRRRFPHPRKVTEILEQNSVIRRVDVGHCLLRHRRWIHDHACTSIDHYLAPRRAYVQPHERVTELDRPEAPQATTSPAQTLAAATHSLALVPIQLRLASGSSQTRAAATHSLAQVTVQLRLASGSSQTRAAATHSLAQVPVQLRLASGSSQTRAAATHCLAQVLMTLRLASDSTPLAQLENSEQAQLGTHPEYSVIWRVDHSHCLSRNQKWIHVHARVDSGRNGSLTRRPLW